ncbi:hypothetical protein ACFX1X_038814 [Malus domestica]
MVVYVQDHVSWGVADIVLTAVMAVSLAIFIIGRRNYRYQKPTGSPLTPMLQVLVAAIAKRSLPHPSDPAQLYKISKPEKSLTMRSSKLPPLTDTSGGMTPTSPGSLSSHSSGTSPKLKALMAALQSSPLRIKTLN